MQPYNETFADIGDKTKCPSPRKSALLKCRSFILKMNSIFRWRIGLSDVSPQRLHNVVRQDTCIINLVSTRTPWRVLQKRREKFIARSKSYPRTFHKKITVKNNISLKFLARINPKEKLVTLPYQPSRNIISPKYLSPES